MQIPEFVIKLISNLVPIKSARREFRQYLFAKYGGFSSTQTAKSLAEILAKMEAANKCAESVQCIALGSSHGAYGFLPQIYNAAENSASGAQKGKAINLASTSQDLYLSHKLLEYWLPKLANLKQVYLFFSVFSNGFDLQRTREAHIFACYNALYDFDFRYPASDELLKIAETCKRELARGFSSHLKGDCGYLYPNFFLPQADLSQRVHTHLRENKREGQNLLELEKIATLCRQNNLQLRIVIAPARADYRKLMPAKEELFKKLANFDENIIDFYDSELFSFDMFGDCDHLKFEGAKVLTQNLH